MVAQSHNIPILSCNVRNILFVGRAKSQHICLGSRKVASYLFWFAQSRANFSFAQSHNIPILSRNGRNIPFFGRAKSYHICFGSRNVAQFFGRAKSQHTHFESQWSQNTFFGSRKVALNLFGRTKLQHTHFELQYSQHTFCGSRKIATHLFGVAQSRIISVLVRAVSRNFSVAQSHNIPILSRNGRNIPFLGRAKPHHICFGSRKVAQNSRLRKVATYPF